MTCLLERILLVSLVLNTSLLAVGGRGSVDLSAARQTFFVNGSDPKLTNVAQHRGVAGKYSYVLLMEKRFFVVSATTGASQVSAGSNTVVRGGGTL